MPSIYYNTNYQQLQQSSSYLPVYRLKTWLDVSFKISFQVSKSKKSVAMMTPI